MLQCCAEALPPLDISTVVQAREKNSWCKGKQQLYCFLAIMNQVAYESEQKTEKIQVFKA